MIFSTLLCPFRVTDELTNSPTQYKKTRVLVIISSGATKLRGPVRQLSLFIKSYWFVTTTRGKTTMTFGMKCQYSFSIDDTQMTAFIFKRATHSKFAYVQIDSWNV